MINKKHYYFKIIIIIIIIIIVIKTHDDRDRDKITKMIKEDKISSKNNL